MIFFTGGQRPASMVTCCRPQGAPVAVVGILSAFLTVTNLSTTPNHTGFLSIAVPVSTTLLSQGSKCQWRTAKRSIPYSQKRTYPIGRVCEEVVSGRKSVIRLGGVAFVGVCKVGYCGTLRRPKPAGSVDGEDVERLGRAKERCRHVE